TVKNFGNQDVPGFDVVLEDTTDHVTVGTQTVAGLVAGATTNVAFAWTPSSAGDHVLVGKHTLSDDKASNNQRFATIPVAAAVTDVAVSSISPSGALIEGHVVDRSEEHTSELQSHLNLVCRLLLEKKKKNKYNKYETINIHNKITVK